MSLCVRRHITRTFLKAMGRQKANIAAAITVRQAYSLQQQFVAAMRIVILILNAEE